MNDLRGLKKRNLIAFLTNSPLCLVQIIGKKNLKAEILNLLQLKRHPSVNCNGLVFVALS